MVGQAPVTTVELLRYTDFALAITGIFIWFAWARRYPFWRGFAVAPVLWLAQIAVFYGVLIFLPGLLSIEALNIWSSAIRMQGIITLMVIGLLTIKIANNE